MAGCFGSKVPSPAGFGKYGRNVASADWLCNLLGKATFTTILPSHFFCYSQLELTFSNAIEKLAYTEVALDMASEVILFTPRQANRASGYSAHDHLARHTTLPPNHTLHPWAGKERP